jgi:SAM-dependent methyltransferase
LRKEKKTVQQFYDRFGWELAANGIYKDTAAWVDLRPVMLPYYSRVRKRAKKFLRPQGVYFLDAGSGALPHPEYADYSSGYKKHVCVDLSEKGLREARKKLQDRGAYVIADMTRLPFRNETFDGISSNHAIYHVPADEQSNTVLELYRVLKPDCTGVIAYTWPTCPFSDWIVRYPNLWLRVVKKVFVRSGRLHQEVGEDVPPLYFHPHNARWFHHLLGTRGLDYEIRCAQLVDNMFSKALVPDNLLGSLLLRFFSMLESWLPHRLAEVARYPFVIIRGGDRETINAVIEEFNKRDQGLETVKVAASQAGPTDYPLITSDSSLAGAVGIDSQLQTPRWGIEVYEGHGLLWLGHGAAQGLQGVLRSVEKRLVQVTFEVEPGPAREDSQRTVEVAIENETGIQTVHWQFDQATTLTFVAELQPGRNDFSIKVLEEATILKQPNGDTRPLLLLLRHVTLAPLSNGN